MLRKIPALVLLLSALAPARAGEEGETAAERLRLARTAMEAKMKLGDALKAKGDLEGALRAYEEALEIYRKAGEEIDEPAAGVREAPERPEVPEAVRRALLWLARHQDDLGHWDADEWMKHDPRDERWPGAGHALFDPGVTGLALLAFLEAGFTDRGEKNPFARNVRSGLRYLITVQDDEGCFGRRVSHHFIYSSAIATLAMSEAYGKTRNPRYRVAAQRGLDFLARARNPYLAWRYQPRGGENDTSVTSWCVLALASGKNAGLDVDPDHFTGARTWIEKMTDPEFGQVGYTMTGGSVARPEGKQDLFPPEKSQAMTAAGILVRMICGEDPRRSEAIRKGAELILELPPVWDPKSGRIDMYYWYFGTKAMRRLGGRDWKKWKKPLLAALLPHQETRGAGAGSWAPVGPWGDDGGRVYATAILAMCLQEAHVAETMRK